MRGLHDLDDPENVYVQPSNGVRHCKHCRAAYARGDLEAYTMCWRGLHDLSDPANVKVRPDGHRQCRPCAREQQRAYRAAKKAEGS
jgi:hypothetical protein